MPQRPHVRPRRRPASVPPPAAPQPDRRGATRPASADDPFFRHIVNSMRNGVIAFRRDGTLALMNDEAYRTFGLVPSAHDLGRPFTDVLRERPEIIRALTGVFELSHLANRAELRLKDLNRVIGYTLSQVKDDAGTVIGAVVFFKDLTRVEQLEEQERLRDRLASLGEMAAGIAHELKNPLAGIEVMAGLLRRQVADSKDAQSLLADILSEAKLANKIVVEMLEFVRPVRLQVERADLLDVLQQSVTMAESKVRRGEVQMTMTIEPGLPAIECDHHQLCQVFTNLVANAFEALDGSGHIAIGAQTSTIEADPAFAGVHAPTPAVVIEVADDGPGVAADVTDKIFNPFFTTKVTGTGLGLAIVRKIVDAHDGRIDVSSAADAGTRFRVTLPVASASGWFK
jgi:nitrogen-specific signal transduction histidine kinase